MIDEGKKLTEVFDATGVRFYDRATVLAAFKENHEIHYDEAGEPTTFFDGEHVPLKDALTRYAYDAPDGVCDRRTLPREGSGGGRRGTASKADFDLAGKVAFIKEHGISQWEQMPSKNADSQEVRTKADWYRLSRTEKVRRTAANPNAFSDLPNAPQTGRVNGALINEAGLEKHKAVSPQRRRR